jgi:hypothetical protein
MARARAATALTVYENNKNRAQEIYKKVVETRLNEGLSYSQLGANRTLLRHLFTDTSRAGKKASQLTKSSLVADLRKLHHG